ncbi:MAG: response regulator, partial [Anaerolineaceae bacterium]|nr:response regulator [Anaerolineaceae bacterium]
SLLKRILNPETRLRERLFQLLSAIALVEFVVVFIYYLAYGNDKTQAIILFAGMILFAGTVAFTFRSGHMRVGSVIAGLLYFSIYPLTFFSSGGMYGGAPPVFAFALVYVFLITENWERAVTLALCVLGSAGIFLAACLHPELLIRHTVPAEHAESLLAVLLVTLLLCMLFTFATVVYRTENRIVQQQKKEIEELNQAQKRFFSNMSHEIRTPVNAIIGFNEMTLRENISEEVRENSLNIETAGKILMHTINEILDMSKLETGMMEIIKSDYRVTAMLSDIVNMTWLRAQNKGLEFMIDIDPQLPTVLRGDEVRIKQVLLNVITNAVKYTKEGSVTLSISGIKEEDGLIRVIYHVKDTGIGIREENIPFLFSAFQRLDEQTTHRIEGTGLGLAIVKQLLDMMEGTVSVASEYGKGSDFRIEIPQEIADESPIGAVDIKKTQQSPAAGYKTSFTAPEIRILAVDDTPMNLMVIKKLLRDTKIMVETASDGAEALNKTMAAHYDLILMDHQMPEMDGIECLHRIKDQQDGKCRDSKIVCLTANVGTDMEQLYHQEGFDGYLVKPIRGKVLEDEILRLVPHAAG